MGEVIQFTRKTDPWLDAANKYNLDYDGKFINGKPFVTESGVRIGQSYGYLKPTGRQEGDKIEVWCAKSEKVGFVKISLLEPFRFKDNL